jgi:hypothetical protein
MQKVVGSRPISRFNRNYLQIQGFSAFKRRARHSRERVVLRLRFHSCRAEGPGVGVGGASTRGSAIAAGPANRPDRGRVYSSLVIGLIPCPSERTDRAHNFRETASEGAFERLARPVVLHDGDSLLEARGPLQRATSGRFASPGRP